MSEYARLTNKGLPEMETRKFWDRVAQLSEDDQKEMSELADLMKLTSIAFDVSKGRN